MRVVVQQASARACIQTCTHTHKDTLACCCSVFGLLQRPALRQRGLNVRSCLEVLCLQRLQLLLRLFCGLKLGVAVQQLLARPHELQHLLLSALRELLALILTILLLHFVCWVGCVLKRQLSRCGWC